MMRATEKKQSLKEFCRYVSLNVLGMLGLSCYILADTYFVSKGLGADGLTALNLAIPVYSFINGCGLMLGVGGATRFSIYKSAGQEGRANAVYRQTLLLAAIFAVVGLLMGLFFARPLTVLMGANTAVFEMCHIYLKVILLFAPMFILNNVLLCFVRNDGAPQRSMAAMLSGSLSNVVLDYIFIFPMGMGIFGAVFATGLAPIISMLVLSPYFIRKKQGFHPIRGTAGGKGAWVLSRGIVSSGLPSLVTEVSSGVVIIVFNAIILGLKGNTGVAAYGVVANLSLVVLAIYTGIAQGIQPIVSRYYGAGAQAGTRNILRYAAITVGGVSLLVYLLVLLKTDAIAAIFNSGGDAALQQIAVKGLRIYFVGCFFAGMNIVLSIYFTSTDRARPAHMVSLLRGFIIIIPAAFLLAERFGIYGVWMAFPATELLVFVVCLGFLARAAQQGARRLREGGAL